jgi:hypothetical protein
MDVECHNKFTTASSVRQKNQSFQIRTLPHCPSQQPPNTASPHLQAAIAFGMENQILSFLVG